MELMMSKLFLGTALGGCLVILMMFQNCGQPPYGGSQEGGGAGTIGHPVTLRATVTDPQLAGCRFLLCSTDNVDGTTKCFVPVGLDPSLVSVGMNVEAQGYFPEDVVTACNAGAAFRVLKISPF
ncbi:MAG: hypothetical protein IT289_05920 [Oligoflexia bacterium]|nr:hypothetical protein [Oligoflexia bacterium]